MTNKLESANQCVSEFVEAFEAAFEKDPNTSFGDFLPPVGDPYYCDVAAELIRVDLENHWERGDLRSLNDYRDQVPRLFDSPERLQEVAFEEYRLRNASGDTVASSVYRDQYNVVTTGWPRFDIQAADTTYTDNAANTVLKRLTSTERMPRAGEQFGEFALVDEIGSGAFAKVFLARQRGLAQRHVALKVTVGESQEPEQLAKLHHTNVVPIYSIHRQGEFHGLCMPYLGSVTLDSVLTRLKEDGSPPKHGKCLVAAVHEIGGDDDATAWTELGSLTYADAVATIAARLADGLAFAHKNGVVHRDIKPANILLASDSEPRLLDFNLSEDLSPTGAVIAFAGGTLPYMSADALRALRDSQHVGPNADVFAIGIVMYQMLTLQMAYPIRRGHFDDVIDQTIDDRTTPPPSIREQNNEVSPGLATIVEKCLHPNSEKRYSSAAPLFEDLTLHLANRRLKHAPNVSRSELCRKWLRRHPRLTSAATVAAVGAIALAIAVGAFVARGRHLAVARAENAFSEFQKDYSLARVALSMPIAEASMRGEALAIGDRAIRQVLRDSQGLGKGVRKGATPGERTPNRPLPDEVFLERTDAEGRIPLHAPFGHLPKSNQDRLRRQLGELLYLSAERLRDAGAISSPNLDRSVEHREEAARRYQLARLVVGSDAPTAFESQRDTLATGNLGSVEPERASTTDRPADDAPADRDLYLLAVRSLKNHDYAAALQRLTQLRRHEPLDAAVWFLSGNANVGLGQFSRADACFTTFLDLRPDSYLGFFYRGRCRMDQRDWGGALSDFSRALDLKPDFTAAMLNRGLVQMERKQFLAAEADLTSALESGDVSTRVYFLRSRTRDAIGNHAGARADWRRGLELTPNDASSWVARGTALVRQSPEDALRDFEMALQLNPQSRDALQNSLYVLIEMLDRKEEALSILDRLLKNDPSHRVALAARAVLRARMGQRAAMLADVETLLQESPPAKSTYQAASALALSDNEKDARRAIQLIAKAVQQDASLVEVANTDPDIASLRTTAEYGELVDAAKKLSELAEGNSAESDRSP